MARPKAASLVPRAAPDNRRPMAYSFRPANAGQRQAQKLWEGGCRILFLLGGAGTGKSFAAMGLALGDVKAGRVKTIYVTRPLVEAGEKMGFLPGEVEDKYEPYLAPLRQVTGKIAFNIHPELIVPVPLGFMRGRTFDDGSVAVLDEAQNCSYTTLKLFISRMGRGSRIIINGDVTQCDLTRRRDGFTDLDDVVDDLSGLEGVGLVEFADDENLRDPFLSQVLKRLS